MNKREELCFTERQVDANSENVDYCGWIKLDEINTQKGDYASFVMNSKC